MANRRVLYCANRQVDILLAKEQLDSLTDIERDVIGYWREHPNWLFTVTTMARRHSVSRWGARRVIEKMVREGLVLEYVWEGSDA